MRRPSATRTGQRLVPLILLCLGLPGAWAQTTVTFKTWAVPEFEQAQTWEYVVAEYAKVHPNRRVVVDVIPFGTDFTTMLTTEFLSGNPADIIVSDRTRANNVDAVEGTILRLDELFDRPNPYTQRTWGEGIYLGVREANRSLRDGSYNTFQIMTSRVGFFAYNRDIFERLDLAAPTTWIEFIDVLEALGAAGMIPLAINDTDFTWDLVHRLILSQLWWDWVAMADADGDGQIPQQEAVLFYLGDEFSFQADRVREVFELHKRIYDYAVPGWESHVWDDTRQAFLSGNVGVVFVDLTAVRQFSLHPERAFELGTFEFPVITTETSPYASGKAFNIGAFGATYAISANVARKGTLDAVLDFAMFLQRPDIAARLATDSWNLPAGPGVELAPPLDGFGEPDPSYQLAYGQLSNWYWQDAQLKDFAYKTHQLFLRGSLSLDAFLDTVGSELTRVSARRAAEAGWR